VSTEALRPALDAAIDVFDDLVKLVAIGEQLDMAYIEGWVRDLDRSIGGDEVSERLRRARAEAAKRTPR
jgi:hypothetical protein